MSETSTVAAKCSQCMGEMILILPAFRVMNAPDVTIIALTHEKAQVCKQCGAGYVPVVKAITPDARLDIQWSKVEYVQKPIVVPPSQEQVRAVQASKGLVIP